MKYIAQQGKLYWTGSYWSEMSIYAKRFATREDLLREMGSCPCEILEVNAT